MQDEIKKILIDVLQLGARGNDLAVDSALIGSIPELDSMAVVTLVTVIEDYYGIAFEDDDFTVESFSTLGALCAVVDNKISP